MTDYYDVLGVPKDASQEDIKRAYKKKAKQYHPDLNREEGAEDKFKEVNQAYKVLSDSQQRAQYDRFGHDAYSQGQSHGGGGQGFSGFDFGEGGFGFEDIFGDIFGGGFGGRRQQRRGADLQARINITLSEAYTGTEQKVDLDKHDVCEACDGSGAKSGKTKTCPTCQGQGRVVRQQRTPFGVFQTQGMCPDCQGVGQVPEEPCPQCAGEGRVRKRRTITVDVPKGVRSGQRIRVQGEGEAGPAGTPAGDLYLLVQVKQHPLFERDGDDLYCEIPISYPQAVFGDDVKIPTLDKDATLEIPSGTQSHTRFRVRGYGMPKLSGGKGDLYVRVKVETPKKLSKKQEEALERFAEESGVSAKPQKGFFDKVRDAF